MNDTSTMARRRYTGAELASMMGARADTIDALRGAPSEAPIREDLIDDIIESIAEEGALLRADDGAFNRRALTIEATYRYLSTVGRE